ncbi:tRNA (adenosine(37)-N6)-threonylcarbamoyltransferase complex ATPase subunit type 1 TsaE [Shimia biformata]|uniref:tRNA (adenosine(37)-N6)-threonylcarbamoyltransferase complex ATPase subunit type 1 TsaE n=1 Tax=Shimia biformata TaxID=1294299 RepID=UPI0019528EBD|nr:tRNA (adenosine(37)-N6)-threonylcarbamoyltransferase complex ATPase subunit type 1 TsaE [Shimia biformata]
MSQATEFSLSSPDATADLAAQLAVRLLPGDVVLLEGDIGTGKTHFARSLIQHLLPIPEDVPSPTFTLVQTYDTADFEIWHADLYRLTSPDEVVELGLVDAFEDCLCLIEWPDRLADLTPENALLLQFSLGPVEGSRTLRASWSDPKWTARLQGVSNG